MMEKTSYFWIKTILLSEEFEDNKEHNRYMVEEQTTQLPKEKVHKDKQLSTKHIQHEPH